MQLNIQTPTEHDLYFSPLGNAVQNSTCIATKYLDLGIKFIRVQCYTPEIIPFLEKQLPYVLRNTAPHFEGTIVVWKINDIKDPLNGAIDCLTPRKNPRLRIEMLYNHKKYPDIQITENQHPVLTYNSTDGILEAYDAKNQTCYYGIQDFNPEELIKQGHLFVQQLNKLLQTENTHLTHGAVLGLNQTGALLCARGQRGKSTLTVHAMINGFDYIADDYQILDNRPEGLFAHPVYSIITLSPRMYNEMYDTFRGKFCCNNARKDKYVFNISDYHSQFRKNYPVRLCLFPEISSVFSPEIKPCSAFDKGRAIVQFIHSTVMQMRDLNNRTVIKKLFNMVHNLPFYKFDLCPDINRNTLYLRHFLENYTPQTKSEKLLDDVLVDVTFDLANLLDTRTFTLYSMNKFATHIYTLLCNGFSVSDLTSRLQSIPDCPSDIGQNIAFFKTLLEKKRFLLSPAPDMKDLPFNPQWATECHFQLSLLEFTPDCTNELIRKGE